MRGSQESGLHHRYKQFHHGLPVLGAHFTVQESKGLVISGIGRLVSGLDMDPNPVLSERAALELALKAVGGIARNLVITEFDREGAYEGHFAKLRLQNRTQAAIWARNNVNEGDWNTRTASACAVH